MWTRSFVTCGSGFAYARAEFDEPPRLETVELVGTVRAAAASFELAACEAGVMLRIDGAPVWVTIDRDRFERALGNILGNALRYTPRGGAIDLECGSDPRGA
jgi:signal transduction histidine kinase